MNLNFDLSKIPFVRF